MPTAFALPNFAEDDAVFRDGEVELPKLLSAPSSLNSFGSLVTGQGQVAKPTALLSLLMPVLGSGVDLPKTAASE